MASLILPSRLNKQPSSAGAAVVDTSHPIARGLQSFICASDASVLVDYSGFGSVKDPYNPSDCSFKYGGLRKEGRYRNTGGGSYRNLVTVGSGSTTQPPMGQLTGEDLRYTTFLFVRPLGNPGSVMQSIIVYDNSSGWVQGALCVGNTVDGRFLGRSNSGQSTSYVSADNTYNNGQYYALAFTADYAAGVQNLWVDGVKQSASGSFTMTSDKTYVNASITCNRTYAEFYASLLFQRVLSDTEIAEISRNPYQLLTSPVQQRKLWVVPASGGGTGITADLSKTLIGSTLSSNASIAVTSSLTKTLTGATLSSNASVAVTSSLTKTLNDATLSSTIGQSVTADLNISLTGSTLSSNASVAIASNLTKTLTSSTLSSTASVTDTPAQSYTLVDDFDDNSLDPTTWDVQVGGTTTVVDTNQRLEIAPQPNSTNYGFLQSHQRYNMTDASFVVKLVQKLNDGPYAETLFGIQRSNNSNDKLLWLIGYGNIDAQVRHNGSTDVAVTPYVPANHSWFRIRHDSVTGKIYWDYAPDTASNPPISTDWVNLTSTVTPFEVTDTITVLGAGCWSNTVSPGTAIFDGVNTQANLPAIGADLSKTLNDATLSSTIGQSDTADLNVSLTDSTLSSNASIDISANLSKTLGNASLSSNTVLPTSADLSKTLNGASLSSNSSLTVSAELAKTLNDASLSSNIGQYSSFDLNVSLSDSSVTSDASLIVGASLTKILTSTGLSSTSTISLAGSVGKTLNSASMQADTSILVSSDSSVSMNSSSLNSVVSVGVSANMAAVLRSATLSSKLAVNPVIYPAPSGRVFDVLGNDRVYDISGADRVYDLIGQDRVWVIED